MRLPALLTAGTLTAAALSAALAGTAAASTPPSETATPSAMDGQTVTSTWTGFIAGTTAVGNACPSTTGTNDNHDVALTIPAGFYDAHTLVATFTITPQVSADAVLHVTRDGTGEGTDVGSSDNGSQGAAESVTVANPTANTYHAVACSFAGGGTYTGKLELKTVGFGGTAVAGGGGDGVHMANSYGNYTTGDAGKDAGEPSIGVNWKTGQVFLQAVLRTVRATFPPTGSGAPLINDVSSFTTSQTSLDPYLFTDSRTGRTFADQLLTASSACAFTDTDGPGVGTQVVTADTPATTGYTPCGQLPTAGVDHQTLGGGRYSDTAKPPTAGATGYPNAVYYCSQGIAAAFCQRSDTGGQVFQPGIPIYTTADGCGGLHGHVRVAPNDGTVYVPNKACGTTQAVTVSQDNGTTWKVKSIPDSSPGASDPSVSAGLGGKIYFGYENGDGTARIATSDDRGDTWTPSVDVGSTLGIKRSVFPTVIAGDNDRASFAFLGSTTPGESDADAYGVDPNDATQYSGGTWSLYVSTTYDGGAHWSTVNASGADPVQRGRICQAGTTCTGSTRNLLDYIDITVDRQGRALVGYADGCTNACATSTKVSDNSFSDAGVIARQISGTRLFASDPLAGGTGGGPGSVMPEAPYAALIPIVGLGVFGVVRRRQQRQV